MRPAGGAQAPTSSVAGILPCRCEFLHSQSLVVAPNLVLVISGGHSGITPGTVGSPRRLVLTASSVVLQALGEKVQQTLGELGDPGGSYGSGGRVWAPGVDPGARQLISLS